MIKYRITQNGINELIKYESAGGNSCCMQEKILSVLDSQVWQPPSAIFQSIKNDRTLRANNIVLGAVTNVLIDFESKGYVTSYDEPLTKPLGGDFNANSIQ